MPPFRLLAVALCLAAAPALLPAQTTASAIALYEQRRFDEARSAFETLHRQNPRDARVMSYLGRIALALDDADRAADWSERAVKQDGNVAEYHYWLGSAVGTQAQRASTFKQPFLARKVKAAFERAVQLDPRHAEARMGLVQYYAIAPGVMGGSLTKAKEQAAEIITINPMRGRIATGYVAEREKNDAAAEREYRAAAAVAPADSSGGLFALASFLGRKERWDEVYPLLEAWIAKHPDDGLARVQYGRAAVLGGKHLERGERELRTMLAAADAKTPVTRRALAHYFLGQIAEKGGRRDAARASYQEALRLNPRQADAKKALAALK